MRQRWTVGVAVMTTLLAVVTGCQGNERAARFDNYLARLGRTIEVTPAAPAREALPSAPRPTRLKLPIASSNLDALDFLAISGCAVQVTIGKRNSSLGRMARDSQRLLLDLEFLALAPQCIDYQRQKDNNEVADTLEQAWQLKREQLPARIFNATLAGAEYREFWRLSDVGDDYPASAGSQVITALEAINADANRWMAGDFTADNQTFELQLSRVATGDGGRLLSALMQQDATLAAANSMVENRLASRPLCAPGYRPQAADILDNVISKFFIGELQPHAAALGARFHALLPPLHALEQTLGEVLPPTYTSWQLQRDSQLRRFASAPRRHVEQLQILRAPCQSESG